MEHRGWCTLPQPCTRISFSILHSLQRCPPAQAFLQTAIPRHRAVLCLPLYTTHRMACITCCLQQGNHTPPYIGQVRPVSQLFAHTAARTAVVCPTRAATVLNRPLMHDLVRRRGAVPAHRGASQPIRLSWAASALDHSQHMPIQPGRGCPRHRENASSPGHVRWEALVGCGRRVERL